MRPHPSSVQWARLPASGCALAVGILFIIRLTTPAAAGDTQEEGGYTKQAKLADLAAVMLSIIANSSTIINWVVLYILWRICQLCYMRLGAR